MTLNSKLIIVTGTPAVGKTTLIKKLVKKLKFERLDLHDYYKEISTGYNRSKQCYDIDLKKFEKLVKCKLKENNLVIDSHIAHLLPSKLVDLCVILTCSDLKKLKRRLSGRKYTKKKVRENLDTEIFQLCLNEAQEKGHNLIIFDVVKVGMEEIVKKITKQLS